MLPEDRYLDFLLNLDVARVAAEDGRIATAHLRLYRGLEMAHGYSEPWAGELRTLYRRALDGFQQRYPWPTAMTDGDLVPDVGAGRSLSVAAP